MFAGWADAYPGTVRNYFDYCGEAANCSACLTWMEVLYSTSTNLFVCLAHVIFLPGKITSEPSGLATYSCEDLRRSNHFGLIHLRAHLSNLQQIAIIWREDVAGIRYPIMLKFMLVLFHVGRSLRESWANMKFSLSDRSTVVHILQASCSGVPGTSLRSSMCKRLKMRIANMQAAAFNV